MKPLCCLNCSNTKCDSDGLCTSCGHDMSEIEESWAWKELAKKDEALKIAEEKLYEVSMENIKKDEMLKVMEETLKYHEHIERDGCRECDTLEKLKLMRDGKV